MPALTADLTGGIIITTILALMEVLRFHRLNWGLNMQKVVLLIVNLMRDHGFHHRSQLAEVQNTSPSLT